MKELSDLLLLFIAAWEKGEPANNEKTKIHLMLKDQKAFHQVFLVLSAIKEEDRKCAFLASLTEDWENSYAILFQIANQCFEAGSIRLACSLYQDSLGRNPAYARAYRTMGNALRLLGDLDAAIHAYRNALAIEKNQSVHSRLLLALNFHWGSSPREIAEEHQRWGETYYPKLTQRDFSNKKLCQEKKRLTIGYISPDFKSHPVAYFIQPILANHDREKYRVNCYYSGKTSDGVTKRIKEIADVWREISGKRATEVAALISEDDVDILVDLAGHTSGNRLDVMSLKPAPVQVTYLGYPNSTGLAAVDYRITDAVSDPVGVTECWYSEKLVRINPVFLTFEPPLHCPAVAPTPALINGYITFGSFNKYSKLSPRTIDAWVAILMETDGSRLLLKTGGLEEYDERARAIERFVAAGLDDAQRIDIMGHVPSRTEHLGMYGRIDIALDPFPYNGTTTTCQALYMGVPMISLAGDRHVARVGASLLSQMGLEYLVAFDVDGYIGIGTELAKNVDALVKLRQSIRPAMLASPLLNHKEFVGKLEVAYRDMWARLFCSPSIDFESKNLDHR